MLTAFLFDLDGTLLDRQNSFEPYLRKQYYHFRIIQKPFEEFRQRFVDLDKNGYGNKQELYQTLIEEYGIPVSVEELILDFRKNAWVKSKLFPGAKEVLQVLKTRGHKLGIITNGSGESQRAKLHASGLTNLVDEIVISGIEKVRKPDTEIFTRAVERMGVAARDCVFIGDNPVMDINGAQKVGMKTIWVERNLPWPIDLVTKPDFTIKELCEILEISI